MSTSRVSYKGITQFIDEQLTVQAAAYASGDLVGGLIRLDNCNPDNTGRRDAGGLIQSVAIADLAAQNITKDVVFFDSNPDGTTFTENAALDIADADLLKIIGVAQVSSWFSFNDNSMGQAVNLAIPFAIAGAPLYAAIVERGAPTYASTADLHIRVGILLG